MPLAPARPLCWGLSDVLSSCEMPEAIPKESGSLFLERDYRTGPEREAGNESVLEAAKLLISLPGADTFPICTCLVAEESVE